MCIHSSSLRRRAEDVDVCGFPLGGHFIPQISNAHGIALPSTDLIPDVTDLGQGKVEVIVIGHAPYPLRADMLIADGFGSP